MNAAMVPTTQLEPLPADEARHLLAMFRAGSGDQPKALALDDRGMVVGVTDEDDPLSEHLLADFDVHA